MRIGWHGVRRVGIAVLATGCGRTELLEDAAVAGERGTSMISPEAGKDAAMPGIDSGSGRSDSAVEFDAAVQFDAGTTDVDAGTTVDDSGPVPQDAAMADGDANVVMLVAPRQIAPMSTATATSQSPLFHWSLPSGEEGAEVKICRDRACAMPVTTFVASGASGAPPAPLTKGVYFWHLRGTAGGVVGSEASATWQVSVGARSAPHDTSWGSVLDVNGDGLADVGIGINQTNMSSGAVQLHLGSASGPSMPPTTLTIPDVPWFGGAVASAGDVNGDGFADLVGGAGSGTPGAAYVFYGGASGLSPSPTTLASPSGQVGYGYIVTGAGDVDGDGFADVVAVSNYGNAYLYLGGARGISTTPTLLQPAGKVSFAAAAGDLNGDGFADVVLGYFEDSNWTGVAHVLYGSSSGLATNPDTISSPSGRYGMFGYSVACAGDVDGDGFADLVVGAPGGDESFTGTPPTVYVYRGTASGLSTTPVSLVSPDVATGSISSPASDFGAGVAGAGDVDGDGFADVVVITPYAARLHMYRGGALGLSTMSTSIQLATGPRNFIGKVAGGGDVNGDGFADVVAEALGGA